MNAKPGTSSDTERRRNPELRLLIDEMLERVRELHRNGSVWSQEERARAEIALEQILSRIRKQAIPSAEEPQAEKGRRSGEGA